MKEEQPLLAPHTPISFKIPTKRTATRFLSFLICLGLLTAVFAVSGVLGNRQNWFDGGSVPDENKGEGDSPPSLTTLPQSTDAPDAEKQIPTGAIRVISMDLARDWNSSAFIENQTLYQTNFEELKRAPLTNAGKLGAEPLVLILHTHSAEAYLPPQTAYLQESIEKTIYSTDEERTVRSVGEALCKSLNQNGIPTIQCLQKHGKDGTLQNAYADSAACIKAYLAQYPSIQYVIDLHRDGILSAEGDLVRTEAKANETSYAQVLAVVGSDGNGTACPNWESNLSLAVQLLGRLNQRVEHLSRGVSLRNASYNQELAYRSLLLEIGSAGNTCEEAMRTARLVGETLAQMILEAN